MRIENRIIKHPFFSICIPQYNRTLHLIEACRALSSQTFRDFEICISDDCSTDGRHTQLLEYLHESGMSFVYERRSRNVRYDANLRASLNLASGTYCLLHGNDDCLKGIDTLERLHRCITDHGNPEVIITNFEDWSTGDITKRVGATELLQGGPTRAADNFRNVAFVTGILLRRDNTEKYATEKWDGSEMYQMYLTSRSLAEGGCLLNIAESIVRKDIFIVGEDVDTYKKTAKDLHRGVMPKTVNLPMLRIPELVVDAISGGAAIEDSRRIGMRVAKQIYLYTYPYWIVEYRKISNWRTAFSLAWSMRPGNILQRVPLSSRGRLTITVLYFLVMTSALFVPSQIFDLLRPILYRLAKRRKQLV